MDMDQAKLKKFSVISVIVTITIYLFHMLPVTKNIEHRILKEKAKKFNLWKLVMFLYYALGVVVGLYIADYLFASQIIRL